VKENLAFTNDASPMAHLMLSVMGALAEFERALIKERQREGVTLAKQKGVYKGRKKALSTEQIQELKECLLAGEKKAKAEFWRVCAVRQGKVHVSCGWA
jgi:DNA invertase Pin-like site-specific DNA recombinase